MSRSTTSTENTATLLPQAQEQRLNYGAAAARVAVASENINSPIGDVCCTAFMAALCFAHPSAPCIAAAVIDSIVGSFRRCTNQKLPFTVFTTDAIDAYNHTRNNENIPPLQVLPCGGPGVLVGLIHNMFSGPKQPDASGAATTMPVPGTMN